ncbi:hypothetical protein KIF24_19800 [Micromonospora sp. Llam7]|uniref:hypothetical protein n=1 Tax=Micromonospora tarapacensis TaxID=2835305 RepID=UPI001C82B78F|nr:hypothetical protein [Micromonospora tarapacensis]MBX7268059.1 hypothetical protein [Micromonospora tarapacensis]
MLLRLLPDLLDTVRQARVDRPDPVGDDLLVAAYGLVALVLVKVDQWESAWLAADRGWPSPWVPRTRCWPPSRPYR